MLRFILVRSVLSLRFGFLFCATVLASGGDSSANDKIDPAALNLQSVSSGRQSTNPNLTRDKPIDAAAVAHEFGLTYSRGLAPNLSFAVSGGTLIDRENREGFSADSASSDFTLYYRHHSWLYSVGVSGNRDFVPFFQEPASSYADISFRSTSDPFKLGALGSLVLQYGFRERFHATGGSSHYSPVAVAALSRELGDSWTLKSTLTTRYYYFIDNPNELRETLLREEVAALKKINDLATIKFAVQHDNRFSSLSPRSGEGWVFGVSLTINAQLLEGSK